LLAQMGSYPTPVLRATVILARKALERPIVDDAPPDADEVIKAVVNSVFATSLPT
jgi:hypothetical protein